MSNAIVLGPLLALLKSRKFLTVIAALISYVIVASVPQLAGYQSTIAAVIVGLAGLLIGGITVEDATKNLAGGPKNLRDAIQEIVYEIIDAEFPPEPDTSNPPSSASANPPAGVTTPTPSQN